MKLQWKAALVTAALALLALPGIAAATGPNYETTPPAHEKTPKKHAYGFYCKGESKKHVQGTPGTPFSQCVKAAARADHNEQLTAREACKALSKKHVKGQQGTPFSVCVKGVAQLQKEKKEQEEAQS
ncbi:MAG: hypothetical protein ACTHK6_10820 [Solirubrobacterales bacterium]